MPLLLSKQINENAAYAVWNIQETFLEIPYLSPEPFPPELHPVRQAEWIIGRVLVKQLCEHFGLEYKGVGVRETGKPYLKGYDLEMSISHSFPMACAMIDREKSCGIDLEMPRKKMLDVQDRFLHASEHHYRNDLEKVCEIWCAKEVIYKKHGRRQVSMRDEMRVSFVDSNRMVGEILKDGEEEKVDIHYEWVKDYVLGYSV